MDEYEELRRQSAMPTKAAVVDPVHDALERAGLAGTRHPDEGIAGAMVHGERFKQGDRRIP